MCVHNRPADETKKIIRCVYFSFSSSKVHIEMSQAITRREAFYFVVSVIERSVKNILAANSFSTCFFTGQLVPICHWCLFFFPVDSLRQVIHPRVEAPCPHHRSLAPIQSSESTPNKTIIYQGCSLPAPNAVDSLRGRMLHMPPVPDEPPLHT